LELQVADLAPVGIAHQFEQVGDSSRRTLYVKGIWQCCLLFKITAPLRDTSYPTRSSKLELHICPAALLPATHHDAMLEIFEDTSNLTGPENLDLLTIFRRVADDGSRSFRVWLGFFSLAPCDYIENIGSVPWSTVVNPLWDKIIEAVD